MTEGSILVTGATGTVGSEVVKQLSDKGKIIRAATRSASVNTFRNLNSVRVVQLDYNSPGTLATAFKGCLLYTSPSPRDRTRSRMPSSA